MCTGSKKAEKKVRKNSAAVAFAVMANALQALNDKKEQDYEKVIMDNLSSDERTYFEGGYYTVQMKG